MSSLAHSSKNPIDPDVCYNADCEHYSNGCMLQFGCIYWPDRYNEDAERNFNENEQI